MPELPGRSVVFLDNSGSMGCYMSDRSQRRVIDVAALFAAAIAKGQNADIVMFSHYVKDFNYDPTDSVLSIMDKILSKVDGGGTDFVAPWKHIHGKGRAYDRVFILSDMQGWIKTWGSNLPGPASKAYAKALKVSPFIYSWDLHSYGDMQFPEAQVACLAGFSEKLFDLFEVLEQDKQALVKEIEKIEL